MTGTKIEGCIFKAGKTIVIITKIIIRCSTYDGSDIGPRHQYHKKCIGDEKKAGSNPSFTTLSKAVKDLNIVQGIKLLKIDIEGFEVDEIASWQVSNGDLPEQIAIELHHSQVMYNSLNDAFDFSNLVCTFLMDWCFVWLGLVWYGT